MSKMEDINKITHTKIGDNIHFYVNGKEDRGVVVKMNNAYLSVLKDLPDFRKSGLQSNHFAVG